MQSNANRSDIDLQDPWVNTFQTMCSLSFKPVQAYDFFSSEKMLILVLVFGDLAKFQPWSRTIFWDFS